MMNFSAGWVNLRKVGQKLYSCSQIWETHTGKFQTTMTFGTKSFLWDGRGICGMLDPHIDVGGKKQYCY